MFVLERTDRKGNFEIFRKNIPSEKEVMKLISRILEQERKNVFFYQFSGPSAETGYTVVDYGSWSDFFRYKAEE